MNEINYALNNLYATASPWTAADHAIADRISDYWVNYISTGAPIGNGLQYWPSKLLGNPRGYGIGRCLDLDSDFHEGEVWVHEELLWEMVRLTHSMTTDYPVGKAEM